MENSEDAVYQRLNFIVETFEAGSQADFARRISVRSGVVGDMFGKRKNKPSFDVLGKIALAYPQLRVEWLLTGEEPALKYGTAAVPEWAKADLPYKRPKLPNGQDSYASYIGNYPVLFPTNDKVIAVINARSLRNYLARNQPPVLPKDLPKYEKEAYKSISISRDLLTDGKHLAFVVNNNQMEPTIMCDDIIICKYIGQDKWNSISETAICALLRKDNELTICRVRFDSVRERVICYFDNSTYYSTSFLLHDISEVWQFELRQTCFSEDVRQHVMRSAVDLKGGDVMAQMQRSIDDINRRLNQVFGTFREGVRAILLGMLKTRRDLHNLDQSKLANEDSIKALYISEYGQISDIQDYMNEAIRTIQSVAFEISLGFKYDSNELDS